MRIQLTQQECRWLADLACKARIEAALANNETPHPLLELRRDNMADLENTLNTAIQRENGRERGDAR
jgi:hypothetical protein